MRTPTAPCHFCNREVDVSQPHYIRVTGWERPRQQGGANQITLRRVEPDVVACDGCIRRGRFAVSPGQEPLL